MKTKMKLIASLKIWVAIYPSITLLLYFPGNTSTMPLYLKTLLLTVVLVPWIVFAGVPFVDLVLHLLAKQVDKKQVRKP